MPVIKVGSKKIELDDEGYLVDFEDWNQNVHQPKNCTYEEFPDPIEAWKIAGLPNLEPGVYATISKLKIE